MTTPPPDAEAARAPACGTRLEPTALPIGDIAAVVLSGDGSRCALCLDVGVFLLDLNSGLADPIIHRAVTASGGAFNHDGTKLLLIDYDSAALWFVEISDEGRLHTRELPCGDLVDVEAQIQSAVSPDGTTVALATADEALGQLVLLSWDTLEVQGRGSAAATYGLSFTPDSSHVIASGEETSYVSDLRGQLVSTMPRLAAFNAAGTRLAAVSHEKPAQLMIGRVSSQQPPLWSPGRGFLPWGDPNDSVDDVAWAPDDAALAVAVGAFRELDGFEEPVWRTDLVSVAPNGQRRATFAEPHGIDTSFANLGRFGFSAGGERLLLHAETLMAPDDPEPVLALHSFDARRGIWLGAIVALQDPRGVDASAGAALSPFGFQEGDGEWAPLLSGRRSLGDASLDIDYGEVGSVIAAVTPDGWYGRLDGAPTLGADVDPYDRREAIGQWLLGLREQREFGPAPPVADPVDAAVDGRNAHAEAAQQELEELERAAQAAERRSPESPEASEQRRGPGWLWTVCAMVATFGAYWWLRR